MITLIYSDQKLVEGGRQINTPFGLIICRMPANAPVSKPFYRPFDIPSFKI